jgi:oxaloacetate decarboxylase alpha subunit
VAAVTRSWLVSPAPGTAGPDDEPVVVDDAAAGDPMAASDVAAEVGPPDRDGRRRVEVIVDGWRFVLDVEPAARAALRARATRDRDHVTGSGAPLTIRAIIPGRVAAVAVAVGDEVRAGQPLLVVEAMKMQNELRAPRDGTIRSVAAGVGGTVEIGDVLVVLG